jgi:hypothetical protein
VAKAPEWALPPHRLEWSGGDRALTVTTNRSFSWPGVSQSFSAQGMGVPQALRPLLARGLAATQFVGRDFTVVAAVRAHFEQIADGEQGVFLAQFPIQPPLVDFLNFPHQVAHDQTPGPPPAFGLDRLPQWSKQFHVSKTLLFRLAREESR